MMPLPLTRAANLVDFDGVCASPAAWQQAHAEDAWGRWAHHSLLAADRPRLVVLNWGASPFVAPDTGRLQADYYDRATIPATFAPGHAAIYCLSVLDRCEKPLRTLRQLSAGLIPGGLLVCTFALWDSTGEDCALGHDLRARIYDRGSWKALLFDVRAVGLRSYGGVDLRYPGDTLGDHSLAAAVFTKDHI